MPSACGLFTKNTQKIKKLKEIGDSRYIYQNKLDKGCFQNDMVHGDFKDLPRTKASDKGLSYKSFDITKNRKYDENQHALVSEFYNFFDKKTCITREIMANQRTFDLPHIAKVSDQTWKLSEELLKAIIRKL